MPEESQTRTELSEAQQPKIGLIAGWGRYPLVIAEVLRRQGYRIYCVGIKDHADPVLAELCHDSLSWALGSSSRSRA